MKNTARNMHKFDNNINLVGSQKESFLKINEFNSGIPKKHTWISNKPFHNCSFDQETLTKYVSPSRQRYSDLLSLAKEIHSSQDIIRPNCSVSSLHIPSRKIVAKSRNQIIKKNKIRVL